MKNPSIKALEFTERHYAALGKVIVAFQSLESTITYGLLTLLQPEKLVFDSRLAIAMVNEHSFSNRLKLLLLFPSLTEESKLFPGNEGLTKVHLESYAEAISLLNEGGILAGEAESKRNQLIHSTWIHGSSVGGPEGTVLRMKSRVRKNKIHSSHEYLAAKEIEEVADVMFAAQNKLHQAIQTLHFLMLTALTPQNVKKNI